MARQFCMAIAPFQSVGGGKFQSMKQMEERAKSKEELRSMFGSAQTEEEAKISEALDNVAHEHGIESPTAVALAYVMCKAPNVFPIVGGRKVEQLMDNIQALKIILSQKQIEYLESVVPFDPGFLASFIGDDPHYTGRENAVTRTEAQMAFVRKALPIGHE